MLCHHRGDRGRQKERSEHYDVSALPKVDSRRRFYRQAGQVLVVGIADESPTRVIRRGNLNGLLSA